MGDLEGGNEAAAACNFHTLIFISGSPPWCWPVARPAAKTSFQGALLTSPYLGPVSPTGCPGQCCEGPRRISRDSSFTQVTLILLNPFLLVASPVNIYLTPTASFEAAALQG